MRVVSYKMTDNTGFAPNPFFGYLTLATCKPGIRASRCPGIKDGEEWLAGFTSFALDGSLVGQEKLVFLMRVDEVLTIEDYYLDARFSLKIPDTKHKSPVFRAGDNIYRKDPNLTDGFEQLASPFHTEGSKKDDLDGKNVLIAKEFWYFGVNPLVIPDVYRPSVPKGAARYGYGTYDSGKILGLINFVSKVADGKHIVSHPQEPTKAIKLSCGLDPSEIWWREDDDSWKDKPVV
jgi:hypothetical protein